MTLSDFSAHPHAAADQLTAAPPPLPVFAALNVFSLISIDLQEDKVLGTVTVRLV